MASVAGSVRGNRINSTITSRVGAKRRAARTHIPAQYKGVVLIAIAAVALVVFMVSASAYCAKLQTQNNQLQNNISRLEADIDSLNEQIAEQTKIENITSIAVNQLHMVYPNSNNCINIDSVEAEQDGNLASAIKEEAYN